MAPVDRKAVFSDEMKAVADFVTPKLPYGYSSARRWKVTETGVCHNCQSSLSADRIRNIEIFKIAIAFEEFVKNIPIEYFATKDGCCRWNPVHELGLGDFSNNCLPAAQRYGARSGGV